MSYSRRLDDSVEYDDEAPSSYMKTHMKKTTSSPSAGTTTRRPATSSQTYSPSRRAAPVTSSSSMTSRGRDDIESRSLEQSLDIQRSNLNTAKDLSTSVSAIARDLKQEQDRNDELSDKLSSEREATQRLRVDITKERDKVANLTQQIKMLELQLSRKDGNTRASDAKAVEANDRLEKVLEESRRIGRIHEADVRLIAELESTLDRVNRDFKSVNEMLSQRDDQRRRLERDKDTWEERYRSLDVAHAELRSRYNSLAIDSDSRVNASHEDKMYRIKENKDEWASERRRLQCQIDDLTMQLKQARAVRTPSSPASTKLVVLEQSERLNTDPRDIDDARSIIDSLLNDKAELGLRIRGLEVDLEHSRAKCDASTKTAEDASVQLADAVEHLTRATNELELLREDKVNSSVCHVTCRCYTLD